MPKGRPAPGSVPVRWTPERCAWFRAFCPGHSEREISAEHERVFGTPLSEGQIANAKTKLGVRSGTVGGRFEKGHAPHNKGKTWDEYGTPEGHACSRETCFKAGGIPHNGQQPVGTERVDVDGYVWVKVAMRKADPRSAHDNWRPKHHLVYEKAHGEIPEGCNVIFADHDQANFDPANLVAVPRGVMAVINRKGIAYWDAESLQVAIGVARLDHATHEARRRPRPCRKCGAEFEPRFPRQRTCDACLGRS